MPQGYVKFRFKHLRFSLSITFYSKRLEKGAFFSSIPVDFVAKDEKMRYNKDILKLLWQARLGGLTDKRVILVNIFLSTDTLKEGPMEVL